MRDCRDPQQLGSSLLSDPRRYGQRLSAFYDLYEDYFLTFPNYPKHESLATVTVRERKEELGSRAAAGDKYAASVLKGEVNDDPSGE